MTDREGGKVLVVDDTAIDRGLLARAIAQLGYDVRTTQDGKSALATLAVEAADLVLLDLLMPVMDGFETLRRIKAIPDLAHVPVIVVSAVEDQASLVRCIELGATDYLIKPFDREVLRARLTTSLATKRLRDVELDHLRQVERVIAAAEALEDGRYDAMELQPVVARKDALGLLARVFHRMAAEVQAREAALRQELAQLRIAIDRRRVGEQAAEVTGTGYYRQLAADAAELKRMLSGEER
ncbi:MAG TPA: response regulator [Jiangellaceae bacterium]